VYLIYSHGNPDHAYGADVFTDTATLIGTPEAAAKLAALNSDRHPVPTMLLTAPTRLELGGVALDLYPAGNTQGDDHLIVHYPARRVLFAVDFIPVNRLVFRDLAGTPSLDDWVTALDWIEALDWDVLVPGHGNLGNKATLQAVRTYLLDLQSSIRSARTAGLADNSPEMIAAVRGDLAAKYGSWENFESWLPENVSGVIRIWAGQ
jgi:glyoxylase-like metal-dependent hydrolase (beta-lactamase superfamily II)